MNCRPGDVAMVVRKGWGYGPHDGKAYTLPIGTMLTVVAIADDDEWIIADEIPVASSDGSGRALVTRVADRFLKPYRPWERDGEDEIIRIAGKPREKVEG